MDFALVTRPSGKIGNAVGGALFCFVIYLKRGIFSHETLS